MPTLNRINPSSTPRASRTSLGMLACVIVVGWHTSDSTPPRLSARLNSFVRVRNTLAAGMPPCSFSEIIPPNPRICFAATAWFGWSGRPG